MATQSDGTAKLSLCMIVRDNEDTLADCLASIRPFVDEMIVVDTGSRDQTPRIARDHGALVSHFEWIDDFSAARNASLERARGEWIFWMDSDDTISGECGNALRQLVDGPHEAETLGYIIKVHCPGRDSADVTVVDHVKLIRNHPEIRFDGRIHEQVLGSIRHLGGEVKWTDIHVSHTGYRHDEESIRRKHTRDLRILKKDLEERPRHPFVLFNLGMTYSDMGDHAEAAKWLEESLRAAGPEESHVRKLYALLVVSHVGLGEFDRAIEICTEGLELFPKDPELLFRRAMLLHRGGDSTGAIRQYREILELTPEQVFSSFDIGILGDKARHNLALAYHGDGDLQKEEIQWRQSIFDNATNVVAREGLVECLIAQQKYRSAQHCITAWKDEPQLVILARRLEARLLAVQGEIECALDQLRRLHGEVPDRLDVLEQWCQLAFEHAEIDEAENALEKLTQAKPNDPAALHNLGSLEIRKGDFRSAIDQLGKSLALRPNYGPTLLQLSRAHEGLGEREAALSIRRDAEAAFQRIG